MSMILILMVLGFPSSQAVRCYSCLKSSSSDCDDPFTDANTCTGNICAKGKHVKDGRLTIYLVLFTFVFSRLTIMFIWYFSVLISFIY